MPRSASRVGRALRARLSESRHNRRSAARGAAGPPRMAHLEGAHREGFRAHSVSPGGPCAPRAAQRVTPLPAIRRPRSGRPTSDGPTSNGPNSKSFVLTLFPQVGRALRARLIFVLTRFPRVGRALRARLSESRHNRRSAARGAAGPPRMAHREKFRPHSFSPGWAVRSGRGSTRHATTGDAPPAERPAHLGRCWPESELRRRCVSVAAPRKAQRGPRRGRAAGKAVGNAAGFFPTDFPDEHGSRQEAHGTHGRHGKNGGGEGRGGEVAAMARARWVCAAGDLVAARPSERSRRAGFRAAKAGGDVRRAGG